MLKNTEYSIANNDLACVSKHQKTFVNLASDDKFLENSNYGPNVTNIDQNERYINQYMEMGLKKIKLLIEQKFKEKEIDEF